MEEISDLDPTPSLDAYLRAEQADRNLWWRLGCGHHLNLFEEAVEQRDQLRKIATDLLARLGEATPFNPDWTISPAETLREIVAGRGWTVRKVADGTGVSKSRVDQFLHGDAYPASWAVAFAAMVGCSPEFIWNLQCNYQLDLARGRRDLSEPQ